MIFRRRLGGVPDVGQQRVEDRRRLLTGLAESHLLDYLRDRQTDKLDALLQRTLGEAYSLERLASSW